MTKEQPPQQQQQRATNISGSLDQPNKRSMSHRNNNSTEIDETSTRLVGFNPLPILKRQKRENNKTIYSKDYVQKLLSGENETFTTGVESSLKDQDDFKDFVKFKEYILRHLNLTLPSKHIRLYSYLKDTYNEISRILEQSIIQKESHSVITVGPRNSFKSFLINYKLDLLSEDYRDQFITIKLNGFIHSENAAINGIATQLENQLKKINSQRNNSTHININSSRLEDNKRKEREEETKEKSTKKNTDNSDVSVNQDDNSNNISSGSLTEVFEKILRLLDSASKEKISSSTSKTSETTKITVVFIFDEIDTFAGPVRQTLLYNLFDMVEHARVPVCIFGNTTKLNILELLEKRVKSRFSQRIIYIPKINSLDNFKLAIEEQLVPMEGIDNYKNIKYVKEWKTFIQILLQDEDSKLFQNIKINYETFKSLITFRNGITPLIVEATSFKDLKDMFQSMELFTKYNVNQLQSSLSARVKSLSNLELAILICSCRVALKTKDDTTNFNLTYSEYKSMVKLMNSMIPSSSTTTLFNNSNIFEHSMKLWSKKDIKNIWETLQALDFLTDRGAVGLRESAIAVFYASNYTLQGTNMPFDLRVYQNQVTLQELRRIVPSSSIYYSWTQL
ncbi:origin recognition complex subunit 4 PWA37_004495 [Arxiozyma heterogenica]|uniref:Origin recognition complex subunit 4 C-terminal domain-containing protein n=1 Tax=Arxiozyma heterogenica TaxID=278026 RepID=A0AAN8A9A0_9SACH|nr:hypothetical protein RI543_000783 [Kazachstania heterogenica]